MSGISVGKVGARGWSVRGITILLVTVGLAGCGKKPGHDKTGYLLAAKLELTRPQEQKVGEILAEIEQRRDADRRTHAGDNAALLRAARARNAEERARIDAVLEDHQRVGFEQLMAPYYGVNDKALVFGERLGLDRATTRKIDPIVARAPSHEEARAALAGNDPGLTKAFVEKTDGIHRELEKFLTDSQRRQFRAMVHEEVEGLKTSAAGAHP